MFKTKHKDLVMSEIEKLKAIWKTVSVRTVSDNKMEVILKNTMEYIATCRNPQEVELL